MPTLGALTSLADDDTSGISVVFACIFLLIVVVAAAYGVMWLRKRLWGRDDVDMPVTGFTLGDLKQLHRTGKLTDQEFQHARDKIVAAHQAAQRQSAKPTPPSAR